MTVLSPSQKEYLVDHVDGSRVCSHGQSEIRTRGSLIALGLIRYEQGLNITARPKTTVITDAGREELCAILAVYAETLSRIAPLLNHTFRNRSNPVERETLLRNLMTLQRSDVEAEKKYAYGPTPNGARNVQHDSGS